MLVWLVKRNIFKDVGIGGYRFSAERKMIHEEARLNIGKIQKENKKHLKPTGGHKAYPVRNRVDTETQVFGSL